VLRDQLPRDPNQLAKHITVSGTGLPRDQCPCSSTSDSACRCALPFVTCAAGSTCPPGIGHLPAFPASFQRHGRPLRHWLQSPALARRRQAGAQCNLRIVYFKGSSSLLSLRRCTRSASPTLSVSWSSPSVRDRGHKMSPPQTNARPMTISAIPRTSILRPQNGQSNPVSCRPHLEVYKARRRTEAPRPVFALSLALGRQP
jgi:hypothetical protein